jgi:AraC-like DNA-binding protein
VYLILQWAGNISFLIYIFYSLNLFAKHRKWVKNNFSNLKNKPLGWLQLPILFYSCFWILWNVLRNIDTFLFQGSLKNFYFLPSFIGVSITTCWLAFKGYIKTDPNVTGFSKDINKINTKAAKPEEAQKILMTMATQKPFLDPNLNLRKLSEITNIPPKSISGIINQDFKTNFYEFINKYRIEEFKQKLQMENCDKITLIAHAYESGFNSKSTFNHVLKKNTGLTPREYYNQCKNESEWKQADF